MGALFEGFVALEILKGQVNRGRQKELYYFRDQQGLEVDFLVPRPNSNLWLVEAKAGKTVLPTMAAPLLSLRRLGQTVLPVDCCPPKVPLAIADHRDRSRR